MTVRREIQAALNICKHSQTNIDSNAQDTAQAPDEQSQNENEDLTEGVTHLDFMFFFPKNQIFL